MVTGYEPVLEESHPQDFETDQAEQLLYPSEFRRTRPPWQTRTLQALSVSMALLLLLLGISLCGSFQATPTSEGVESLLRFSNAGRGNETCHDAEEGDSCHKNIVWAKSTGIHQHPEWYSGLTAGSDLKSFQLRLHQKGFGNCSQPCGTTCEDASPGSKCGIAVTWAKKHGIYEHPEWYNKLNAQSTVKEFQEVLHAQGRENCSKPCSPLHEPPSLFCFTLMMPTGYEPGMVQNQLKNGLGIFGCDAYAVYSNASLKIPPGNKVPLQIETIPIGGSLEVPIGGKYQVLLNKQIFVRVWASVVMDGRPWYHDWTAKLDVDAVFIPARLRGLLRYLMPPSGLAGNDGGDLVFLKNCKYTLYGAVEVLSRGALWTYRGHWAKICTQGGAGAAKVEDRYLNECLKQMGVRRVDAFNLLDDAHCHDPVKWPPFPCKGDQATFHPFKTWESYLNCYNQAMR